MIMVKKISTPLNSQKTYLRTNFIETNNKEDIDMKNQTKLKNLPTPIDLHQNTPKSYVDNKFNDPSITKKHSSCWL